MAELKWTNVDGGNMNSALTGVLTAENTMYSRIKDLNQVAQDQLNAMQTGIEKQWEFEREQNTQEILNQMYNANSIEEMRALQKKGLDNANTLTTKYGTQIDLSKINQAKASWVSDSFNRQKTLDEAQDYTEVAKKRKAEITQLVMEGKTSEATALLRVSEGVFSNAGFTSLNQLINERYLKDREFAVDSKYKDAQTALAQASAFKTKGELFRLEYDLAQDKNKATTEAKEKNLKAEQNTGRLVASAVTELAKKSPSELEITLTQYEQFKQALNSGNWGTVVAFAKASGSRQLEDAVNQETIAIAQAEQEQKLARDNLNRQFQANDVGLTLSSAETSVSNSIGSSPSSGANDNFNKNVSTSSSNTVNGITINSNSKQNTKVETSTKNSKTLNSTANNEIKQSQQSLDNKTQTIDSNVSKYDINTQKDSLEKTTNSSDENFVNLQELANRVKTVLPDTPENKQLNDYYQTLSQLQLKEQKGTLKPNERKELLNLEKNLPSIQDKVINAERDNVDLSTENGRKALSQTVSQLENQSIVDQVGNNVIDIYDSSEKDQIVSNYVKAFKEQGLNINRYIQDQEVAETRTVTGKEKVNIQRKYNLMKNINYLMQTKQIKTSGDMEQNIKDFFTQTREKLTETNNMQIAQLLMKPNNADPSMQGIAQVMGKALTKATESARINPDGEITFNSEFKLKDYGLGVTEEYLRADAFLDKLVNTDEASIDDDYWFTRSILTGDSFKIINNISKNGSPAQKELLANAISEIILPKLDKLKETQKGIKSNDNDEQYAKQRNEIETALKRFDKYFKTLSDADIKNGIQEAQALLKNKDWIESDSSVLAYITKSSMTGKSVEALLKEHKYNSQKTKINFNEALNNPKTQKSISRLFNKVLSTPVQNIINNVPEIPTNNVKRSNTSDFAISNFKFSESPWLNTKVTSDQALKAVDTLEGIIQGFKFFEGWKQNEQAKQTVERLEEIKLQYKKYADARQKFEAKQSKQTLN